MGYRIRHLKIELLDDIPTPSGSELKFLSHHDVIRDVYDENDCHKGVFIKDENGDNIFIRSNEYSVDEQKFD